MLTAFTQVGGIIYLLNTLTYKAIRRRLHPIWLCRLAKYTSFLVLYLLATFILVPVIARPFGRVPLPVSVTNHLRPLSVWTCLLNRNYARSQLRDAMYDVANEMGKRYPGTVVNYLDASFPFINGYGLFPHLSHNDGRKLDLSFCYDDRYTGQPVNSVPSPVGYGICEEPVSGEANTAMRCAQAGYWQYSLLRYIVPQGGKKDYTFDAERTTTLVRLLVVDAQIEKIFIEPHLKARLGVNSGKIRFHGCQAVRHDDHIHVQVR